MKRIKITLALVLFVQFGFAQIQTIVEPGLTLKIYSNKYVIEYCTPEFELGKEYANKWHKFFENFKDVYSVIEFLTGKYDNLNHVGFPALPFRSLNLQVPDDASGFNVVMSNLTTQTINLPHKYLPHQRWSSSLFPTQIDENAAYYASNGAGFYDTWYKISDTYNFMGTTGVTFNIYPIKYTPNKDEAEIIKCATFTINFKSSVSLITLIEEYLGGVHYNDAMTFYDTYADKEWKEKPYDKGNYVILTHNNYYNAVQNFAKYKQSIGYNVSIYRVPNDVAANKDDIRKFIKNLYNNTEKRPRFVLLVGNPTLIPYSYGSAQSTTNPPTDLYYACIAKSSISDEGVSPQLYIGRWSVSSEKEKGIKEVGYITEKTIKTELALYNTTKNDRHFSLFSGNDSYQYWFYEDIKRIKNRISSVGMPYKLFDGRNGFTKWDMISELNGSNKVTPFVFVYSGHGASTSVGPPYWLSNSNISSPTNPLLINNHLPYQPFGFGFACLLNDYSVQGNFGEGFTTSSMNGGVTFFASTVIAYVDQNYYSIPRIFDYFKDKKNYNIAQITAGGMTKYYNALKVIARKRQVQKYNLLGDPSLLIYGVSQSTGNPGSFLPPKRDNYVELPSSINVFPTLAKDFIKVDATPDNNIASIVLYSLNGQIAKTFNVFDNLNIQDVANGQYILLIVSNNKNYSFKIIINH